MAEQNIKSDIIRILKSHKIGEETAEKIAGEIIALLNLNTGDGKRSADVYIDGGSRGNPGSGASAFIIFSNKRKIAEGGKYYRQTTNNEAEYNALILALRESLRLKITDIRVFTDSELLERQIKGIYSVKSPALLLLFRKSSELIEQFGNFSITHIPREKNSEADRLANIIMDTKKDLFRKYNE